MATLLEKAKAHRPKARGRDVKELIDLAVAYAEGEITHSQAADAMGVRSPLPHLGAIVLSAMRRGEYRLVKVEAGGTDADQG